MAGKVCSPIKIPGAAFSAGFWLILDGREDGSSAGDCRTGKTVEFVLLAITIKAFGGPLARD